jgi:23S rRNA (guanosine2251-2'-O)-methyltransferase
MENDHQIFRTRAIIEAIHPSATVDIVHIQKEASNKLMKDLMKVMKRGNINFSYVPVENQTGYRPITIKVL